MIGGVISYLPCIKIFSFPSDSVGREEVGEDL